MTRAVLLVNMGGPANLTEVRPYLRAIFRDPAILPVTRSLRPMLSTLIVGLRARKVEQRYRLIGGASPLLSWTEKLRESVERELRAKGDASPVAHGYRYSQPLIATALARLKTQRVDRVCLAPLFPHATRAMTGSIESEARRAARMLGLELDVLPAWGNQDAILALWRDYLIEALSAFGPETRVLFVAHGIPMRDVRAGDDYPDRVHDSARAIVESLPLPVEWTLAFQSKVGPMPWTPPDLDDEIARLCATPKPLIVMPLSFAADCLETLYDLDRKAVPRLQAAFGNRVLRVRAFNDDPRFARALVDLIGAA
ncbi:MAG: ferrochelatase [bacterium]|nr:ferrochelatase [bacterium]